MTCANRHRSRNAAATRDAILQAARHHFLYEGYDRAGLRSIAADAGIDPALICRYFGSKKQLFAEVLETTSDDPMQIFAGEVESCGQRIADAILSPGEKSEQHLTFIQLVTRSSTSTEASRLVHEHMEKKFVLPFSRWLGGPHATEKAWMMASMLMGWVVLDQFRPADAVHRDRLAGMLQDIIKRKD